MDDIQEKNQADKGEKDAVTRIHIEISKLISQAKNLSFKSRLQLITECSKALFELLPEQSGAHVNPIWKRNLEGILVYFRNNFLETWLLPSPCADNLERYRTEYETLELNVWSEYVAGSSGEEENKDIQKGILDRTQYVFITWDLSDLSQWTQDLIDRVGRMLWPLSKRAMSGNTVVHRLIFVDLKKLNNSQEDRDKLFGQIWLPYFFISGTLKESEYYVSFFDKVQVKRTFKARQLPLHLDIALFSFESEVKKRAKRPDIVPILMHLPTYGYHVVQCGGRTDPMRFPMVDIPSSQSEFLDLYIIEKEKSVEGSPSHANEIIKKRTEETRAFVDSLKSTRIKTCDKDIKELSKSYFQMECQVETMAERLFLKPLDELTEQERTMLINYRNNLIPKVGIIFKNLF